MRLFFKNEKNFKILTVASSLLLLFSSIAFEFLNLWSLPFLTSFVIYLFSFFSLLSSLNLRFIQLQNVLNRKKFIKSISFELILIVPPLIAIENIILFAFLFCIRQLVVCILLFSKTKFAEKFLSSLERSPAKLLIITFILLILTGTFFLSLPRSTIDNKGAEFENALFTATSATCVTGLIVINTYYDENAEKTRQSFSLFGQIVILILIQLGGLGIMNFSTSAILFFRGKFSFRTQKVMQEILDEKDSLSLKSVLKYNFIMTFVFEFIGFIILSTKFYYYFYDYKKAMYYGLFHSISAFNNAGFSLFSNSLINFRDDFLINITVGILIIIGGIGPMVVASLFNKNIFKFGFKRLELHTKIVLISTAILIITGFIIFYFFEFNQSMKGFDFSEKILSSLFQSITSRTAGFNTVDISSISRITALFFCVLMFIGGSPGGTAGGVKTSSFVILLLAAKTIITGKDEIEIFGRTIRKENVLKAFAVFFISSLVCFFCYLLLIISENDIDSIVLLFETFSAFGTVGLSMGATFELSVTGKFIIIAVMFIGRVGPVAIATGLIERKTKIEIKYPEGKIYIG